MYGPFLVLLSKFREDVLSGVFAKQPVMGDKGVKGQPRRDVTAGAALSSVDTCAARSAGEGITHNGGDIRTCIR
jgi:hypothetical protein